MTSATDEPSSPCGGTVQKGVFQLCKQGTSSRSRILLRLSLSQARYSKNRQFDVLGLIVPTTTITGIPGPVLTSTSISVASMPTTAAEKTRVIMEESCRIHRAGRWLCKQFVVGSTGTRRIAALYFAKPPSRALPSARIIRQPVPVLNMDYTSPMGF